MADVTTNSATQKDSFRADRASTLDIRDPDSFQETVLGGWHWVEKHAASVGAVIAVGLLILSGFALKNWWHTRAERKAQESYYAIEHKFTKIKEGFDRAKMRALMPAMAAKDDKKTEAPATGDLEKDYGAVISDLEKVAHDASGSAAGAQAAIILAETYLSYNQPEKAVAASELASKHLGANSLLGSLVRVQWGSALAAKGDCKEAVNVWGQILAHAANKFLLGDVSLRSGLCYEQIGDLQKAKEMYQKAAAEAGAESPLSATAKGLERALILKSKS